MKSLEREIIYSFSYRRLEDNYSGAVEYIGGVGNLNTHFFSQKVYFGRDRHNGFFFHLVLLAQNTMWHNILVGIIQFFYLGGSSFGVGGGDSKVGVGPRTTHLSSNTVGFWVDGENFVLSRIMD